MELIKPNDPQYFTQTSNESYDRHRYELVFVNGQSEQYDSWESVRGRWFEVSPKLVSHVNVLDLKQKKKKFNGGFK